MESKKDDSDTKVTEYLEKIDVSSRKEKNADSDDDDLLDFDDEDDVLSCSDEDSH